MIGMKTVVIKCSADVSLDKVHLIQSWGSWYLEDNWKQERWTPSLVLLHRDLISLSLYKQAEDLSTCIWACFCVCVSVCICICFLPLGCCYHLSLQHKHPTAIILKFWRTKLSIHSYLQNTYAFTFIVTLVVSHDYHFTLPAAFFCEVCLFC